MGEEGLRYHIVTSNVTLLVIFIITVAVWLIGADKADSEALWWGGLAGTTLIAYFLLELNNRNALLRVRSRMVASTFLLVACAMTQTRAASWTYVPPACLLLSYYTLFSSYQNYRPQGYVFHAFLFLGIGSMAFPQMLLLAPLFLLFMVVQLRSFTLKSFMAALLGAAFPILLREACLLTFGMNTKIFVFTEELTAFAVPDYSALTEHQIVSALFLMVLSVAGIVHFWRTKFNDKIRTRMLYYIIMIVEFAIMALVVLQPQHYNMAFGLLEVNSSLIIAHHLTLARGKIADAYFYVFVLLLVFMAFYNYTGYNFGIWPL